jgi:hypothetical protein
MQRFWGRGRGRFVVVTCLALMAIICRFEPVWVKYGGRFLSFENDVMI